jgi:hypothetical protein
MKPRELVNHIHSGPAELVLNEPLRFRRRTWFNGRFNPCDFNEFLQVLRSNETIRTAFCGSQHTLGITEDDWVLLVETLGTIKGIDNLTLRCTPGSREFDPFQAIADAVNNAESLRELEVLQEHGNFPRDPSGMIALANALRERTALLHFAWYEADFSLDHVLRASPACPHLRMVNLMTNYASADAMQNLLQLPTGATLFLTLTPDHWLAVAGGIGQGRCNVQTLYLAMPKCTSSEATGALQALASAIQADHNMKHLHLSLRIRNGFADEAGVAMAKALTVNNTLRKITLHVFDESTLPNTAALGAPAYDAFSAMLRVNTSLVFDESTLPNTAALGAPAYDAFSAMLRVNTSLVLLKLPPFETAGADERLVDSWNQMRIEQRLNQVGRGKHLMSSQTTKEKWIDALHKLNSSNVIETPEFNVSCLYSLLLLKPEVC